MTTLPENSSPWSVTPETEAQIEAARQQERAKEEAAIDQLLIEWYHMKEPYIGKKLVLDRNDPDFDPFMIDL